LIGVLRREVLGPCFEGFRVGHPCRSMRPWQGSQP
jgi:hypothetical protein